jgi:hypothetical protein
MTKRSRDAVQYVDSFENDEELSDYDMVVMKSCLLSKEMDVSEHVRILEKQKCRGSAKWWPCFRIVTKEVVNTSTRERWSVVRLQCKSCDSLLSAINPSISASHHVKQTGPDGKTFYECHKDTKARKAFREHTDATPCEVGSPGPSAAENSGMVNASSIHSMHCNVLNFCA